MPSNFSSRDTSRRKQPDNCLIQSCHHLVSKRKLSKAISSLDLLSQKGIRLPSETLAFLLQQLRNKVFEIRQMGRPPFEAYQTENAHNVVIKPFDQHVHQMCSDVSARKVFVNMPVKSLYSYNNMLLGYASSGMMKPARSLFEQMPERDIVSWNTMIIGYAHSGDFDEGLRFYKELRMLSIGYIEFSFATVLTICVKMKDLKLTRQVHGQVLVAGFLSNLVISSSVLDALELINLHLVVVFVLVLV